MEEKRKIFVKTNIIKIIVFLIIVVCLAILSANYLLNDDFREQINSKIFNQTVTNSSIIEIDGDTNPSVIAYNQYIAVLNKNVLTFYNELANECASLNVTINNSIEDTVDNYMIIGEKRWK